MRGKVICLFVGVFFAVALMFSMGTHAAPAAKAATAAVAAPAPVPAPAAAANAAERHPEIREAIDSLRRAKDHMEHAAHDFGGHRVEAIRATDVAIHQLEECLKYDH
jgi:hypothetical protein